MKLVVAVHPAREEHAHLFAPLLRAADVAEIDAAVGRRPLPALVESVRCSSQAWVAYANDDPVCIWGCAPYSRVGGVGLAWMLGTPLIETYALRFLRESRGWLGMMLGEYGTLINWVDERNRSSIDWLRWLGARFDPPAPWGVRGLPFRRFTIGEAIEEAA